MAIDPSTLTGALQSALNSVQIRGAKTPAFSKALATGFRSFLSTVVVQTTHTGVTGSGTGTGTASIPVAQGTTFMVPALEAFGFQGSMTTSLAGGIANGLGSQINANAQVQVAIQGTATGTGTGGLANLQIPAFTSILTPLFISAGFGGPKGPTLAAALATGISNWLRTTTVQTQDVGSPSPPFSTATGSGTGQMF